MADVATQRAIALLTAIGGSSDPSRHVVIPGNPWSKSRPRFGRGRTYSKPEDVDAEVRTGWHIKAVQRKPFEANVAVACIFFRSNRQRIDVDNLLKHVCDSANRILWADDSQCTAVVGVLELDEANPRTVVAFGEHSSSLGRGMLSHPPCEVCGQPIRRGGAKARDRSVRTCSIQCAQQLRGTHSLAEPIRCAMCGVGFVRRTTAQRLCSAACRVAHMTGRNRERGQRAPCTDCGKALSHSRGGRCRPCWLGHVTKERQVANRPDDITTWDEVLP